MSQTRDSRRLKLWDSRFRLSLHIVTQGSGVSNIAILVCDFATLYVLQTLEFIVTTKWLVGDKNTACVRSLIERSVD